MKTKGTRTILVLTLVLVVAGIGVALVQAGWGNGGGPRGYACPRYGASGDLSREDYDKLAAARDKFLEDSRELRRELDDKHDAVQQELAKENPDRDKVRTLQRDIANLRSEIDAKRREHQREVPGIGSQSARGGRGYRAAGYCW